MIDLDELHSFPLYENNFGHFLADLVIVEKEQSGVDEKSGEPLDWCLFNVYVIIHEPPQRWKRRAKSDCIDIEGHLRCDIKTNGLIYYWCPEKEGKIKVSGLSGLELKSVIPENSIFNFLQN